MTDIPIDRPASASASATTSDLPRAANPNGSSATVIERMLGLTAALALATFCVGLEGGHAHDFLQIVPFAMICSITLGGLIMSHGPCLVARLVAVCFGSRPRDESEALALRSLCQRGRRLAYAATGVQVICSAIHVLSVLDQPSVIGPGLAVALTALVIGPLVAELGFGSAEQWAARPIL